MFIFFATLVFWLSNCVCSQAGVRGYRTEAEAGVANVLLFKYDPRDHNFPASCSLSDALLPYVAYVDRSGQITDGFFDGILLVDTSPFYRNPWAATKKEWENYLEATFKVRRTDRTPVFSQPGYMSRQCLRIPRKEGCAYQESIYPEDNALTLRFYVKVGTASDDSKDGYIGIMAFDRTGRELTEGLSGLTYSSYLGLWYRYVDAETSWQERWFQFELPEDVHQFSVFLGSWHTSRISYDNISLDGATMVNADLEGEVTAWKYRDFPRLPFSQDRTAVLVALDQVAGVVAEELKDPEMKERVILMIPWGYRSHLQTDFGRIDGKKCNPSRPSDATRAIKWFIRRCVGEWKRLQPEHLELAGFYWLNEEGTDFRRVSFAEISDYIHGLGYKFYASPYQSFWNKPSFNKHYLPYFDCLWLQPNAWPPDLRGKRSKRYYSAVQKAYHNGWLSADSTWVRNNGIPTEELKEAQVAAESLNMGINMEWTGGQEPVRHHGRILDYMNRDDSLPHDFAGASHLFFDAAGFGWHCCYSDNGVFRDQYDAVYEFVKESR